MGMNTLPQYEADDGPLSPAQIKQLAEKAGIYIAYDNRAVLDKELEFFAELIVQECLVVINQSNGVGDDDVIKISQDVKKHFGVE
jgi:hypothetical protein